MEVAVIGGRQPMRSTSLVSFLERNQIEVLSHPNPYLSDQSPRASFTDDRAARNLWGRQMTKGEIGCHLSHRHAYEAALSGNSKWLLVFEDDAIIFPQFLPKLTSMLEVLKQRNDPVIVNLDLQKNELRLPQENSEIDIDEGGALLLSLRFPEPNSSVYLINNPAMELAMRTSWRVASPPDWPPWSHSVDFLASRVRLAETTLSDSLIFGRNSSPSLPSRIRRLMMGVSGLNFLFHREHYLGVRNYIHYEFNFRAAQSFRSLFARD